MCGQEDSVNGFRIFSRCPKARNCCNLWVLRLSSVLGLDGIPTEQKVLEGMPGGVAHGTRPGQINMNIMIDPKYVLAAVCIIAGLLGGLLSLVVREIKDK